jgi:acetylornithine deacetylase/succinyl-diaminopimelate desuccinylase-like protein
VTTHAAVSLAADLIRVDSLEGHEEMLSSMLAPLLLGAGLSVDTYELSEGRVSLVASVGQPRVTLTGHLDTVPIESGAWLTRAAR